MLPIFVALIAISVVVIVSTLGGWFEDDGGSAVEADPAITAFWVNEGGPLLQESRTFAPDMPQHVNDGQSCRPSEEIQGINCDDLPDLYESYAQSYEQFAATARSYSPPEGLAADWWDQQIEAWDAFAEDLRGLREAAVNGYGDEEWAEAVSAQRGSDLQSEAELLLAKMLPYVEDSQRLIPVTR